MPFGGLCSGKLGMPQNDRFPPSPVALDGFWLILRREGYELSEKHPNPCHSLPCPAVPRD